MNKKKGILGSLLFKRLVIRRLFIVIFSFLNNKIVSLYCKNICLILLLGLKKTGRIFGLFYVQD